MIYFVSDGEYVKIGFTDDVDVDRRLAALQIGNARKLTLLGVIEGGRESETVLHRVFDGIRIRGEWFRITLLDEEETDAEKEIDISSLSGKASEIYNVLSANPRATNTEIGEIVGVSRQYVGQVKKILNRNAGR